MHSKADETLVVETLICPLQISHLKYSLLFNCDHNTDNFDGIKQLRLVLNLLHERNIFIFLIA